jgi:hypothetical protein
LGRGAEKDYLKQNKGGGEAIGFVALILIALSVGFIASIASCIIIAVAESNSRRKELHYEGSRCAIAVEARVAAKPAQCSKLGATVGAVSFDSLCGLRFVNSF